MNWCYDVAQIGYLVRASFGTSHFSLRITLRPSDPRLLSFRTQLRDGSLSNVEEAGPDPT